MLAFVVSGRDMLQRVGRMRMPRLRQHRRQGSFSGNAAATCSMHHARLRFSPSRCPSCGSDRSVTMAISSRFLGSAAVQPRQVFVKPLRKCRRREHAPHQVGFGQRGREKIRSVRFELGWIIGVAAEIIGAPLDQQLAQRRIADGFGVVEGEGEAKRRVRMQARPNCIVCFGRKSRYRLAMVSESGFRFLLPPLRFCRRRAVHLLGQLQRPRPAVGPLERLRARAIEVRRLGLDVFRVRFVSRARTI